MSGDFRLKGGRIDKNCEINFTFNGQSMRGYLGDTLASALLANKKHLVARSFKYHRPRGIFSAGSEEPNALVTLVKDNHSEPNLRATTIELYEGLEAKSQNHKGSLEFDLMRVNDFLSPFLSAGFYYKTFMWPKKFWEKLYEPVIRAAAGLGSLDMKSDPSVYDKGFLHCDLLIIGAGPAGLIAASEAANNGLKVLICDEDFLLGGRLNSDDEKIEGLSSVDWVRKKIGELKKLKNVRLMNRTTVYGAFDHGIFGALERKTDHIVNSHGKPRQVLWKVYSKRSLLCAGASERGISFGNNDRPGILLSSALRSYATRWAVKPGEKIAVFTNNNDGWRTARVLREKGCNVVAVIDSREDTSEQLYGINSYKGKTVVTTSGIKRIKSVTLNDGTKITVDCLGISGGWNPNIHLTCHQRGRPEWNHKTHCFIPGETPIGMKVAGSANGLFGLSEIIQETIAKTQAICKELNFTTKKATQIKASSQNLDIEPLWHVAESKARAWVDMQNDVTTKDIYQSHMEGFRSVEHLKRYTTLGMATDQGKNSNIIGLAIMAQIQKKPIEEVGTTIFRPPFTPISIGALAGRGRGKDFRPYRLTPSHKWATENGAIFVEAGNWLRAQWFPKNGETFWRDSVNREVKETRTSVGICDVTTLGKIDIKGKDAGEFLNRIYANNFGKLPIGKTRYGLMLREDGIAYDDGTTARFSENHFVMTTTTANAVLVFRNLEFYRQCIWSDFDVHLISTTDMWAQFAVAGPNSRKLLQKIVDKEFDISNEKFPFMGCKEITVCDGIIARLFRISFSGELAFELAVPTRYGDSLIRVLMEAGKEFQVTPYGTEALGVMRIEKGHAAGNELNGQTSAQNLGMGRMISKKNDCVGNIMSEREEFDDKDGLRLVGFKPMTRSQQLKAGAHFFSKGKKYNMDTDEGWMTSVAYSPILEHYIGLGYIKNGSNRLGEKVMSVDLLNNQIFEVEIVSPHFLDPEGERLRA
ncbi:MAG: sarcosine oxidase subunit alpha family protein [Paracoccaceae bacterium]|nr:sarcosine oxidase subunit alpha family protein [Paracoccaceae bacterium]